MMTRSICAAIYMRNGDRDSIEKNTVKGSSANTHSEWQLGDGQRQDDGRSGLQAVNPSVDRSHLPVSAMTHKRVTAGEKKQRHE